MFLIKNCRWLHLNCGPLVLEATALSTGPQPLPIAFLIVPVISLHLTQTKNLYVEKGCSRQVSKSGFGVCNGLPNGCGHKPTTFGVITKVLFELCGNVFI